MGKGGFGERGGRGGGRGGFRGGRGGGRGGFSGGYQQGPPDEVVPMGSFQHACEGEMVCKSINPKVPYFNAPIYLENKSQIGKVDEILGPLNEVYFTVKMQEGMVATSFKPNDKVYIGGDKLLPLERFLPKPKVAGKASKPTGLQGKVEKRGGGGRGGFRGGRGGRGGEVEVVVTEAVVEAVEAVLAVAEAVAVVVAEVVAVAVASVVAVVVTKYQEIVNDLPLYFPFTSSCIFSLFHFFRLYLFDLLILHTHK
ncbi:Gar1/Naf1 RNA binding region-domain-containing protein [Halteromyces radiatus]|uniref:Gar1/Naf1 RNA binding region-domain-containing protein n=1 Tax=Halteromyces radiatus TaxID=101107 RepID=UPI0022208BB9|nr:Gar1/Naf1 RNA binding region-domain-containing protein [Halteromyces radiatus]KAI8081363.1 Gar1/Naf1 RNA binding region-domain-containing protein [Halteromyces radiatus]